MLRPVEIVFDLRCYYVDRSPRYRIYVDNDLLAERTFTWPADRIYIEEHCLVNLSQGPHKVEVVNIDEEYGRFEIHNVKVDGQPSPSSFMIQ